MQLIALLELLLLFISVIAVTCFVGFLFAAITAAAMKGGTWKQRIRRSVVNALPFAAVAFVVSPVVLQRSYLEHVSLPGTCVLPSGYKMMMTDADSPASVYNPKNESARTSVQWQQDGVDGVRSLQVDGRLILGARDSHGYAKWRGEADSYFLLDTKAEKLTTFSSQEQLEAKANELHLRLRLRPAYSVYQQYGLMATVPVPPYSGLVVIVIAFALLVRWFFQLWRLSRVHWVAEPRGELTGSR
jgi:hypothetical protein